MSEAASDRDLRRIEAALVGAGTLLAELYGQDLEVEMKGGHSPVTEADRRADALLAEMLREPGDGWLSEETVDDLGERIGRERVWIVDPLDGTHEFVHGVPEWCVSIGLIEDGVPVAGGIHNPIHGQLVLGAPATGVTLNGERVSPRPCSSLATAIVHASDSEVDRGEWDRYANAPFEVVACGSIAYKLGLLAGGLTDAVWTLRPKHEWDVAGGVALVHAAGGHACYPDGSALRFNCERPKLPGIVAFSAASRPLFEPLFEW